MLLEVDIMRPSTSYFAERLVRYPSYIGVVTIGNPKTYLNEAFIILFKADRRR
jgi:hypothetical protein